MLDPDPHKTDADPKHWLLQTISILIVSRRRNYFSSIPKLKGSMASKNFIYQNIRGSGMENLVGFYRNNTRIGGDIFRVQTRRVPLTIVFRYREIGVRLCTKC
jgi:hypothetical protein